MSDRELKAIISAQDKASPVFKTVASGADKMGTSIAKAGDKGAQGLKKSETAASSFSTRMAAAGAAATAAAGLLAGWSRSSQDADAIQRQLEASIAATGESFSTYADRIEAAGARAVQLGQDDEAASQAISALTQITGSASTALDQMGLVMDLAAAKHMSLESAAELVGKVYEGNTGVLARYGIIVKDGATAEQALLQISAQVAGQAEASATTYARLREEFSNITDAIGGTAGEFAPLLAMLPGASAGFSLVGSAVGALAPNLTKAGVASAALNLAMGPVGIVAGAAAAAVGLYKLADAMSTSYSEDAAAAEKATVSLTNAINNLAASGSAQALIGDSWSRMAADMVGPTADIQGQIEDVTQKMDDLGNFDRSNPNDAAIIAQFDAYAKQLDELDEASSRAADFQNDLAAILVAQGPAADAARESVSQYLAAWQADPSLLLDTIKAIDEINAGLPAQNIALIGAADAAGKTAAAIRELAIEEARLAFATGETESKNKSLESANAALITSYQDTADGAQLLADLQLIAAEGTEAQKARVYELFAAYQTGTDVTNTYVNTVKLSAAIIRDQTKAQQDAYTHAHALTIVQDQQAGSLGNLFRQANAVATELTEGTTPSLLDMKTVAAAAKFATDGNTMSLGALFKTSTEGAPGIVADYKAQEDAAKAAAKAALDLAIAFSGIDTLAEKLRPIDLAPKGGDKATGLASQFDTVAQTMDTVLTIFGSIDKMGQQHSGATSIVENLVGKPGEWAKVDDLLKDGAISRTRYNQTVEAGNNILNRSGAIESDLAVIRAKQLPLLDEADKQYAEVIDKISHMGAAEQTAALGFLDTNESMKAQSALALAAAAANTEVGSTARAAAQASIEGAIAADPYLEAMLTQIGLVSRDHEGNLVINFDNADSLNESTDRLTESIDALTLALGGIPPSTEADIKLLGAEAAKNDIDDVISKLDQLNGKQAFASMTVTNTTNNVTNNKTNTVGSLGFRDGGIVPHAYARNGIATGGMMAVTVGEAGPETAFLPGGTYVRNNAATRAAGGGNGAGGFVFNNYGAIHGMSGIDEVVSSFERSLRAHLTGLGVL